MSQDVGEWVKTRTHRDPQARKHEEKQAMALDWERNPVLKDYPAPLALHRLAVYLAPSARHLFGVYLAPLAQTRQGPAHLPVFLDLAGEHDVAALPPLPLR